MLLGVLGPNHEKWTERPVRTAGCRLRLTMGRKERKSKRFWRISSGWCCGGIGALGQLFTYIHIELKIKGQWKAAFCLVSFRQRHPEVTFLAKGDLKLTFSRSSYPYDILFSFWPIDFGSGQVTKYRLSRSNHFREIGRFWKSVDWGPWEGICRNVPSIA